MGRDLETMPNTYYFSFRSPYSWLATRLILSNMPANTDLEWVPFWEPDSQSAKALSDRKAEFPYQKMSDAKHRYILQDVRRLARDLGVDMQWPVDEEPHWEVAHLGYLKARELGGERAYMEGVYRARWENGRNISDPAVISDVANEAGLDGQAVALACQDPAIREQGVACLLQIYKNDVFGVPYFMHKRDRFWGLDRLPLFLRSVSGQPYSSMEFVADHQRGAIYEFDHAGGCG